MDNIKGVILNESSTVRETRSDGELGLLSFDGSIPGGLHFYWENETGKHSFTEATLKQARTWAQNTAKKIWPSDILAGLATIIGEIPPADTITKAEAMKEFRRNVRIWFEQFYPKDRQIKIVLIYLKEVADYTLKNLTKCVEAKLAKTVTIQWSVDSLPSDAGIYRILFEWSKL
ncbi:MAG: hypothetical protein V1767_06605 [Chloroflexota bacterium]